MRPNAALAASNGNRGQGAGAGPAAPAASFGTPHRERNGVALDDLIRSLEAEWQLGLKLHGLQSPSQRAESLSGKVYGQIQFLHYSSPGVLHKLLDGFRQMAPVLQPATRLELLNERLNMEMPSKSRTGTPASSQGNRNVPPKTLKSAQPCEFVQANTHNSTREDCWDQACLPHVLLPPQYCCLNLPIALFTLLSLRHRTASACSLFSCLLRWSPIFV